MLSHSQNCATFPRSQWGWTTKSQKVSVNTFKNMPFSSHVCLFSLGVYLWEIHAIQLTQTTKTQNENKHVVLASSSWYVSVAY